MLVTAEEAQGTLGDVFEMSDMTLHAGTVTTIRCRPAPPDHGIVFHRVDKGPDALIPARLDQVCRAALVRRTTLGDPAGASVATCEHLLSAFFGAGIDNALVELEGEEIPFFDGSAQAFLSHIRRVGVVAQDRPRRCWTHHEPLVFAHGATEVVYVPGREFRATVFVDYGVDHVGAQVFHYTAATSYEAEIAPARTFCFLHEVARLREAGLIVGGSLDNALVIHDEGYVNKDLRFPDEVVRHKTLDLLGDLMLLGHRLRGHVLANRAGHATHLGFADALLTRMNASS